MLDQPQPERLFGNVFVIAVLFVLWKATICVEEIRDPAVVFALSGYEDMGPKPGPEYSRRASQKPARALFRPSIPPEGAD